VVEVLVALAIGAVLGFVLCCPNARTRPAPPPAAARATRPGSTRPAVTPSTHAPSAAVAALTAAATPDPASPRKATQTVRKFT